MQHKNTKIGSEKKEHRVSFKVMALVCAKDML